MNEKILIDFRREPGVTKARDIQDEIDAENDIQKLIDNAKKQMNAHPCITNRPKRGGET